MHTLNWRNPWLKLPEDFYQVVHPTALTDACLVHSNQRAAALLGLPTERSVTQAMQQCWSGRQLLPGMQPVATVYAGHQFGIFTSQLGDGRAISLGQVQGNISEAYEVQVKGGGLTPYSRTLDGRCPLSSAIREYLGCEALAALGIASTRALCLLDSRSEVRRERIERAALLVRIARSHIRFGHYEYFHHRDRFDAVRALFEFTVEEFFPELLNEPVQQRPLRFLANVVERTACLVADWQSVGFTHGVMNTDNMTISGETLDFGPFGFIETFDPAFTSNPADDQHRYQFDQQPDIGRWNCLALAQALVSLLPKKTIPAGLLRHYRQSYQQHYLQNMRAKLGLYTPQSGDTELIEDLLVVLYRCEVDYPLFFRHLAGFEPGRAGRQLTERAAAQPALLDNWLDRYQQRLTLETLPAAQRRERMDRINPCYVLRRHLLDRVVSAAEQDDFNEFRLLLTLLQNPFDERLGQEFYQWPMSMDASGACKNAKA